MISRAPRPFVFIHIPKNAGTSIEKALLKYATAYSEFEELPLRLRLRHHLPGSNRGAIQHDKYKRYAHLHDLSGYYIFTVVRNPFTRAISQINYLRNHSPRGKLLFQGNSWKDWLVKLATTKTWHYGHDLSATQTTYLYNSENKICCNFIARFETLERDWMTICEQLRIDSPRPLPHIFKGDKSVDWRSCYDEESKELIANKYRDDLLKLSYSFDKN